ncbi:MAG: hypothetical protein IJ347_03270, partial [Faecalibacterium sp.]|nr:hypothetical protein [Faecalibacterium sp.]
TCTAAGNIEYYTCGTCGKLFKDAAGTTEVAAADSVIPVNSANHSGLTEIAAVAATCTTAGATAGEKCTACGTVTKAPETVAPIGHKYAEGSNDCINCDYVKPDEGSNTAGVTDTQTSTSEEYQGPTTELTPEQEEIIASMTAEELNAADQVVNEIVDDAHNDLLNNTAVNEFSQSGMTDAVGTNNETTAAAFNKAMIEQINEDKKDNNEAEEVVADNAEVHTEIHIAVQLENVEMAVEIDPDTKEVTAEIATVTCDVKPMATVYVDERPLNPNNPVVVDNTHIKRAVVFRLPIPASVGANYKYANVYHNGSLMGQVEIQKAGTEYYIEVVTGSFSKFEVSDFTNDQYVAPPAPVDPAPAVPTSPKTADSFSMSVYAMMMLASAGAAVVVLKKREQF